MKRNLVGIVLLAVALGVSGCDDERLEIAQDPDGGCQPSCEGRSCGPDGCGGTCGTCDPSYACDEETGTCTCTEAASALCERLDAHCGTLSAKDLCGLDRTVDCGECTAPEACNEETHQCECVGESDQEFCTRYEATCGQVYAKDRCGAWRTVESCGTCPPTDLCEANRCELCVGEEEADLCSKHGKDCGSPLLVDRCGEPRTVECGTCSDSTTCIDFVCGVFPNDSCANAEVLELQDLYAAAWGSTRGVMDDASGSCTTDWGSDVFYKVILPEPASMEVKLTPDSPEVNAVVYVVSGCGTEAVEQGCRNAVGTNVLPVRTLPAGEYFVVVDATDPIGFDFNLEIRLNPPAPAHDTCDGAVPLEWDDKLKAFARGDTTFATHDASSYCAFGGVRLDGPDLVYRFTLQDPATVTVKVSRDALNSAYRPAVSIRTGCSPAEEVVCALDLSVVVPTSTVEASLPAGTFYVFVDGIGNASQNTRYGPFTLELSQSPALPGADCGSPETLEFDAGTGVATATGTVVDMTRTTYGSCGFGDASGADVVYAMTLASDKVVTATLSPVGTTLIPNLYIRTACNDYTSELACTHSTTALPLTIGPTRMRAGTYFLWVDSLAGFEGAYMLTVTAKEPENPVAANDTCAGAVEIALDAATPFARLTGDTHDGFDDASPTCTAKRANGGDLFYKVVLAQPGTLVAALTRDASTPAWAPVLSLRSSCGSAAADEKACVAPSAAYASLGADLPAGTYYLVVDGQQATSGKFTLEVAARFGGSAPDTCAFAEPLVLDEEGFARVVGDLSQATAGSAGSCAEGTGTGADLVYSLSLPGTRDVAITVLPSGTLQPAVYLRSACGDAGSEIACNSKAEVGPTGVSLMSLAAGDYFVFVDAAAGSGAFAMQVQVERPAAAPANDLCEGALPLTLPASGEPAVTVSGTTGPALPDYAGSCGTAARPVNGPDVVYTFTLAKDTQLTALLTPTTSSASYMPALYLRKDCESAVQEVCRFNATAGSALTLTTSLEAGTWFLIVGGASGTYGAFDLALSVSDDDYLAGESCANPIALGPLFAVDSERRMTATFTGDSTPAANDETGSCQAVGDRELVYYFTLDGESLVHISLNPGDTSSNYTAGFYVRRTCTDRASEITCTQAAARQTPQNGVLNRLPAGTYYLFIDTYNANATSQGTFSATVTVETQATGPANDVCTGAVHLALPGSGEAALQTTASTVGATNNYAGSCAVAANPHDGPDIVYKITIPAATQLTANVKARAGSGSFKPAIYLRKSCESAANEICKAAASFTWPARIIASLEPGDYYLIVDGQAGTAGEFDLDLSHDTTKYMAGDNCLGPVSVDALFSAPDENGVQVAKVTGDTTGSQADLEGGCWAATGSELVYTFEVARGATMDITVGQPGTPGTTGYRPSFAIRRVCSDPLEQLYCFQSTGTAAKSARVTLAAGTYYLLIGSPSTSATFNGPFEATVTLTQLGPQPANDACGGATPLDLSSGTATVNGATWLASDDSTGNCAIGTGAGRDVVYSFTITEAKKIVASVTRASTSSGYQPVVYIRSTCDQATAASEWACARTNTSGTASVTVNTLPAGTYYVWVDGMQTAVGDTPGDFTLTVTASEIAAAPTNDTCPGATPLPFLGNVATVTGDASAARDDTANQCQATTAGPDVVYSFEVSTLSKLTVVAEPGQGYEQAPALEIRRTCGAFTAGSVVECRPAPAAKQNTTLTVPALEPGHYFLWVDAKTTGPVFNLTLTLDNPEPTPENDTCAGAIPLTRWNLVYGSTVGATNDYLQPPLSPVCARMIGTAQPMGPDVIYSYTPATDGFFTVVVRPVVSFNPMIWVTEEQCAVGNACEAMVNAGANGVTERAMVPGVAGKTYYIGVDNIAASPTDTARAGEFAIIIE